MLIGSTAGARSGRAKLHKILNSFFLLRSRHSTLTHSELGHRVEHTVLATPDTLPHSVPWEFRNGPPAATRPQRWRA